MRVWLESYHGFVHYPIEWPSALSPQNSAKWIYAYKPFHTHQRIDKIMKLDMNLPKPEESFEKGRSTDPHDHIGTHGIETLANGHPRVPVHRFVVSAWSWKIKSIACTTLGSQRAHSVSDQFKVVGQRRAPVRSWWNPRSVLTLRAKGGFNGWPRGVIQSKTALFRLLVSSDRALEAPFCSFGYYQYHKIRQEDYMHLQGRLRDQSPDQSHWVDDLRDQVSFWGAARRRDVPFVPWF